MGKKCSRILVIMLLFSIVFIGCNKSTDNGSKLTITGLDVYEGQYIVALSRSVTFMPQGSTDSREMITRNLWGAITINDQITNVIGSKVSNGEVTLNVYYRSDGIEKYNGNNNNVEFTVYKNTSENFDFSGDFDIEIQNIIGDIIVDFTPEGGIARME